MDLTNELQQHRQKSFFDKEISDEERSSRFDSRIMKKKPSEGAFGEHPLQHTWTFWFLRKGHGGARGGLESYEKNIKQVGTFSTVEGFWNYYSHMLRPNDLQPGSDYHLFKDGIRPVWEDEANRQGGKWVVRLRKGLASRYWEEFLLAVVGEQFDVGEDICGVVISVRYQEDILSVWNKSVDMNLRTRIHDRMKRILYSVPGAIMEYKEHEGAINSTFQRSNSFHGELGANPLGMPPTGPRNAFAASTDAYIPGMGRVDPTYPPRPLLDRIGRSNSSPMFDPHLQGNAPGMLGPQTSSILSPSIPQQQQQLPQQPQGSQYDPRTIQ